MQFDDIRAELKTLYEQLDENGDGKLSAAEWSRGLANSNRLCSRYFGDSTAEEHAAMFELLDTDGNGDLTWGEVSCLHLLLLLLSAAAAAAAAAVNALLLLLLLWLLLLPLAVTCCCCWCCSHCCCASVTAAVARRCSL